jgi:F0F1-type ATP synthase membrane subunit b/b'
VVTNRDRRPAAAAWILSLLATDAHAAEGGLVLAPDWPVLGVLVVFFTALVPVVNRLLLAPMLRVLDGRSERTEGARKRAARLEEQVRETVARYERAIDETRRAAEGARREVLDDARRRAAEETGAARSDAETEIARARREIGAALGKVRGGLRAEAEGLAREAASRVLGRGVA